MREILFRGKGNTKYNDGDWYEGYLIKDSDGDYQIFSDEYFYTVVSETVGQYTGLTDRNGVKIFEGDIVKDTKDNDEMLVVDGSTAFGFDFRYINDAEEDAYTTAFDIGISDDNTYLTTAVVVGNVYDNPELLEVEK